MKNRFASKLFVLLLAGLTIQIPSYAGGLTVLLEDDESVAFSANDEETIARLFRNGQHNRVVSEMNRLRNNNAAITNNMIYYEGRSLERLGQQNRAVDVFNEYIEKAPSSHRYMREAVVVLNRLLISHIEVEMARAEEDRVYNQAISENTPGSLQRYLNQYPNGRYRSDVLNRLDRASYNRARSEGTRSAYSRYVSNFPNGAHTREAQARINNIDARSRIQSLERQITDTKGYMRRERSNRNGQVFLGILGIGAVGGALYAAEYYGGKDETYQTAAIIGVIVAGTFTWGKFSDASKYNRRYKSSKRSLEEVESELNALQRGISSIEVAPKIDPYNRAFAMSINIRF